MKPRAVLRAMAHDCENFTSGIGSCHRYGRQPFADEGVSAACYPCIAWDALRPWWKRVQPPRGSRDKGGRG